MIRAAGMIETRSTELFLLLAALSSVVVLRLGLGLTFFSDEWAFIESRSLWDPTTWWAPHNEHWSTIPVIVYGALLELVGLRSYLPYLVVVYGLHVVACAGLFVLVRRRVGALLALAASLPALLLGAGFENLYWGFQIGFVGSTAAGLWALVVLEQTPTRARTVRLTALLIAGLATSGVGMTFVVVVGITVLLRREWRGYAGALTIPVVLFAAWFLVVGRAGVGVHREPLTIETVVAIPGFVAGGLANAAGAVFGIGPDLGGLAAVAVVGLAAVIVARNGIRRPALALACAGGLAFQYALIAAARAGVTEGQVNYSRYTYVGAFLLLVALADLAGPYAPPRLRRARLAVAALFIVLLELSLVWNVRLLFEGRDLFAEHAMSTRALVTIAIEPRYSDRVADDRSLVLVPAPRSLREIVQVRGSPLSDLMVPWAVPPVTSQMLEDALERADDIRSQGPAGDPAPNGN